MSSKRSSSETGIGVIAATPPSDETNQLPVRIDTSVFLQFHATVHIFTRATTSLSIDHSDVIVHKISKPFAGSGLFLRILGNFLYQLKYSYYLQKYRAELGVVFFRGTGMVIPMTISRLSKQTILYRMAGVLFKQTTGSETTKQQLGQWALRLIHDLMCRLSDAIIITSPHVAQFGQLEAYEHKLHRWQHYYFDLNKFDITKQYEMRRDVIGHVGVISDLKGSPEFARAMCQVNEYNDVSVLVAGNGPARDEVKRILEKCAVEAEMPGFVDRDSIPGIMNRMKLLIISSVSEGVPKVLIEAIACGTPVIATTVGGIPDYINEGKTGFLIEENTPEAIRTKTINVLSREDLPTISTAARDLVEDEFSYESSVAGYGSVLDDKTIFQSENLHRDLLAIRIDRSTE